MSWLAGLLALLQWLGCTAYAFSCLAETIPSPSSLIGKSNLRQHAHANKNQKKKTLVMPSIPLTPVDNKYAPFFSREKNARSRKRKVISPRRRNSHATSHQGNGV